MGTSHSSAAAGAPRTTWRTALEAMAAAGLGTGFGLFGLEIVRGPLEHRVLLTPDDSFWLNPLASGLVFLGLGLITVLPFLVRRRPVPWRLVVGAAAALASVSVLWEFPALHPAAAVLLAAGIGVQAGRLTRRSPRAHRVTAVAATLALVTAGLGAGRALAARIREGRALAGLPAARPNAPNVLLLILDTVRSHNLGAYGYPKPTSPFLDRLAARGARAVHALSSAPWTRPAHASMFTGHEAFQLTADWERALDDRYPVVAEYARSQGYATGAFVANAWYAGRKSGFGRGFIRYDDYQASLGQLIESTPLAGQVLRWVDDWRGKVTDPPARKWAPRVNHQLLSWLDAIGHRPYFAFLNYYDGHAPYFPPAHQEAFLEPGIAPVPELPPRPDPRAPIDPKIVSGAIGAYDASIRSLDDELARLFDSLDARGALANTLVIVASDHGEEFYEHGLPEHGTTLYRQALEVPLLLVYPGHVRPGSLIEGPVSLRNIATTIAQAIAPDRTSPFPGHSLIDLAATGRAPATPIFAEVRFARGLPSWYPVSQGRMLSVVSEGYHYIRNADGRAELYDFDRDPAEQHDLAATAPPALVGRLATLVDSVSAFKP